MGDSTTIEWVGEDGKTFNAWIGCEKVSAGCKHCYAERDTSNRVSKARGLPLWGPGSTRRRTSEANWKKPLAWNREARQMRAHCARAGLPPYKRPRVFCASLADMFEGGRPELDAWRADLWKLIEQCDELDWLLLTKRPENVRKMAPKEWIGRGPCEECEGSGFAFGQARFGYCPGCNREDFARAPKWPRHVWLGTTVENQAMADERIPHLLRVPAAVRFLSVEPLLGPVDLRFWLSRADVADLNNDPLAACMVQSAVDDGFGWAQMGLSWVIVGGESGPNARPMHPDWVRSIRDQCVAAGVPFFFKQWGEWLPCSMDEQGHQFFRIPKGVPHPAQPAFTAIGDQGFTRLGKKAAGRELDGRMWDEVPNG